MRPPSFIHAIQTTSEVDPTQALQFGPNVESRGDLLALLRAKREEYGARILSTVHEASADVQVAAGNLVDEMKAQIIIALDQATAGGRTLTFEQVLRHLQSNRIIQGRAQMLGGINTPQFFRQAASQAWSVIQRYAARQSTLNGTGIKGGITHRRDQQYRSSAQ